jgi:hypothetical protein
MIDKPMHRLSGDRSYVKYWGGEVILGPRRRPVSGIGQIIPLREFGDGNESKRNVEASICIYP